MGGSAPMRQRRDLHSGLRGSDNAFGVLRLVLATSVIFSHAFYLGGWDYDPTIDWTKGQESIGGLAVIGFFVISGYLITKSGMRIDILQFMWHRSLRIFPAFWAVLIVTATVVGPELLWADVWATAAWVDLRRAERLMAERDPAYSLLAL